MAEVVHTESKEREFSGSSFLKFSYEILSQAFLFSQGKKKKKKRRVGETSFILVPEYCVMSDKISLGKIKLYVL